MTAVCAKQTARVDVKRSSLIGCECRNWTDSAPSSLVDANREQVDLTSGASCLFGERNPETTNPPRTKTPSCPRRTKLVTVHRALAGMVEERITDHDDEILSLERVLDEAMRDLHRGLKLNVG
jgi:hypothetical protein